jgi:hypothetical protein
MYPTKTVLKLTHNKIMASTYNDNVSGDIKPSAWEDVFTDHRLAFMVNCRDDMARMQGLELKLARPIL